MWDFALFALIAIFSIGLVIWVGRELRSAFTTWARRRAEEDKRRREEAIRIARESAPELAALRKAVTTLDIFVSRANAYRPKFITLRSLISFFPRDCEGTSDGPDPEQWVTTVGNLLAPKAHELGSIYEKLLYFDPPPPPEYPRVELPHAQLGGLRMRLFLH